MDNKRIGIVNDIAIIVEKIKGKFYPMKAVIGHYVFDNNIFVDNEGMSYEHLLFYNAKSKKTKYFIGSIPITKKNVHSKEAYFENFTPYCFTLKNSEIICENIITLDRFVYQDSVTNIHHAVEDSLQEALSQLIPENEEEPAQEETKEFEFNQSITEIKDNLKTHYKGSNKIIEKIASCIFEKYSFESTLDNNILLLVPSEDEKKQIMNAIKKSVTIPVYEIKLPELSDAEDDSYDADSLIVKLLNSVDDDVEVVENSIIFINGLEKLSLLNKPNEYKKVLRKLQRNLSELLEQKKIVISQGGDRAFYSTKNNLFINVFNLSNYETINRENSVVGFDMSDKNNDILSQNQYGLIPELLDKTPNIIPLNKSTEDQIYDIILNDENGFVSKTKNVLKEEYGIEIKNLEHVIRSLSKEIIEKKSTTIDAIKKVQKIFDNVKYEIYEHPGQYNELILGKDILNDNNDFTLKKIDKKIKVLTER